MQPASDQRVGLAIVRVWLEDDPACSLRARVTTIDDVAAAAGAEVEGASCGVDALLAQLRTWLDRWLADS